MRVLAWFSCGAASAVAAKLAVEQYGEAVEVCYCDTLAYEHPDNQRFMDDVAQWIGIPITVLKSPDYTDIFDVFRKTRWLVGIAGARCTTELKKKVRMAYQRLDDLQVFGFTSEEGVRVRRFAGENPEINGVFPLYEQGITKAACHQMIAAAGIATPVMYRLGYKNNNCIGCVKGGTGYWNKIRVDFPEAFARMAKMERELNAAICKQQGVVNGKRWRRRVFLDELPPNAGKYKTEPEFECGVLCQTEMGGTDE